MKFYEGADRFLIAVDCVIFGFDDEQLKVLLIKRPIEPAKGRWSLMGGFLEHGESLDRAAERVLCKLTGLSDLYMEQVYTFGDTDRDPGERALSVAYFALINVKDYENKLSSEYNASWFPFDQMPEVIFDHAEMVRKAYRMLKKRVAYQPIGFELLPKKFTIPQLQSLYEAIHQEPLDKRNFRKKIVETGLLEKLDEKEKTSSRKGAFLYKFNKEKYRDLAEQGLLLNLKVKRDPVIKENK